MKYFLDVLIYGSAVGLVVLEYKLVFKPFLECVERHISNS